MLGKYGFYEMVEHTFIHGLLDDIVQNHIMPKLMEPILVIKPQSIDVIEKDDIICEFMVPLCIYEYMGVNKAWHLYFGMRECMTHLDWLFMNWTLIITKDSMEWEEHSC